MSFVRPGDQTGLLNSKIGRTHTLLCSSKHVTYFFYLFITPNGSTYKICMAIYQTKTPPLYFNPGVTVQALQRSRTWSTLMTLPCSSPQPGIWPHHAEFRRICFIPRSPYIKSSFSQVKFNSQLCGQSGRIAM